MTLSDAYIEDTNSKMSSLQQYSVVERICFGHNLYYIYTGANRAFIVPVSAFESEEQKKAFFDILFQKTGINALNNTSAD